MKVIKLIMLFCIGAIFLASNASGQANPSIAVLPSNSGIVSVGATNDFLIAVGNTGPTSIALSKLRPIVTIPPSVVFLPDADQTGLPAGWTILSNTGTQLRLCNSGFVVPGFSVSNIMLKVQGVTITGPQTFSGQINFGNGTTCAAGTSVAGNNTADDFATSTIEVIAAAACNISVTASAGTIACNGGTTTLTATASGATGAVEYSLNGGTFQAANTFTVNAAGSPYTVTAREATNATCTATSSSVAVSEPAIFVPGASVSSPIATIGATGSITVTGGVSYVIASGTTTNTTGAASGVFTSLLAGTYTFTATNAAGCTGTSAAVVLNNPAACIITGVSATAGAILCNAGTTTLTATATPAGTYQYSLNGGAFQASGVFNNVPAGAYTIVARETGNPVCTATTNGTIAQPAAVAVSALVTTPIATPGGTGVITVSATGGTGAKTYVITSGPTVNTSGAASGVFTGLAAGSYVFTATDANACTGTASIVLVAPGIATADPAVGQMYFTTTAGGTQSANTLMLAPSAALYDINIPFYNLNQLNQVPNGTIQFKVSLGSKLVLAPGFNLATAPLSAYFTFSQADVNGNIVITGTQTAAIPADFAAVATFRVKGDSACRSNVQSDIVITNQLQTLVDDDLQNNTATLQYTLPVTLTQSQINVTCNGAANGIISIIASSGTTVQTSGPAGYSNTQSLASGQNNLQLTGLAPGVYTIMVSATSDAPLTSCSQIATVTILQPTALSIASTASTNINCFGDNSGSISMSATGGTMPYVYTIVYGTTINATGALSGNFTGLAAGTYTIRVTDNNGCTADVTGIIITQPVGGVPDISLGSDVTGSFFSAPGVTQTIVYNVAEIGGNSAVGDTIRITKVAGFTINFNATLLSTNVGGTTYTLDNPRWKIDNTDPAFVSIILTDPGNPGAPGTLLCNQLKNVAISITRNTSNISTFTLSARLRKANGEVNLSNNLNSIIFAAE